MKLFLLSVLFLWLLLLPKTALAADSYVLDQDKFFLQTSADKESTEIVIVKNTTDQPINLSLVWKGYDPSLNHSLDFAKVQTNFIELQPFASGNVSVVFNAPESLKPGDYYGGLEISNGSATKTANFTLRNLGELKESLQISSIETDGNNLIISLNNNGNVTTSVGGKVIVTNFFGAEVLNKKIDQFEIKALDSGQLNYVINTKIPGPYQVRVESSFGQKENNHTQTASIWLYPYLFWGIIILILTIVIVAIVVLLNRKHVQETI